MGNPVFYREGSGPGTAGRRRQGLIGTLAWTVGIAGGFLAMAAISTLPVLRGFKRRRPAQRHRREVRDEFSIWRLRMLGRSKRQVAEALGAPPAACGAQAAPSQTYWDASTWYYPYDPGEKSAVAIEFQGERVAGVEFIRSPE